LPKLTPSTTTFEGRQIFFTAENAEILDTDSFDKLRTGYTGLTRQEDGGQALQKERRASFGLAEGKKTMCKKR